MASSSSERALPMRGLRVLDIGTNVAGPFAATLLGDFGAEVLKMELPSGDPARALGYPNPTDATRGLWWLSLSRNKLCATLDVRQDEGRALFLRLVGMSDVLVESFRPGSMEKWGLGYDVLSAINPGLIMLRVSGYGQTGPKSALPGYDRVSQAYAVSTYITGHPDGPPTRASIPVCDYGAAMFGCVGVLMALYHRDALGGKGQVVDSALHEAVAAQWMDMLPAYDLLGVITERWGNRNPNHAPGDVYRCSDDRWVHISGTGEAIFGRIARAMGKPELASDPRYLTNRDRVENREALEVHMHAWAASLTREEFLAVCAAAAIPCGPVNNIADAAADEHMWARETIINVPDAAMGRTIRMQGVVPKLSETPGRVQFAGPGLGEHNEYVYKELLGLSAGELAGLRERRVI